MGQGRLLEPVALKLLQPATNPHRSLDTESPVSLDKQVNTGADGVANSSNAFDRSIEVVMRDIRAGRAERIPLHCRVPCLDDGNGLIRGFFHVSFAKLHIYCVGSGA